MIRSGVNNARNKSLSFAQRDLEYSQVKGIE